MALADVFDALCSDRCYKKAWSSDQAMVYVKEESGRKFDPVLVELLLENVDEFIRIRERYPD